MKTTDTKNRFSIWTVENPETGEVAEVEYSREECDKMWPRRWLDSLAVYNPAWKLVSVRLIASDKGGQFMQGAFDA